MESLKNPEVRNPEEKKFLIVTLNLNEEEEEEKLFVTFTQQSYLNLRKHLFLTRSYPFVTDNLSFSRMLIKTNLIGNIWLDVKKKSYYAKD